MELIDKLTAPPGNWAYQQPQSGLWMNGVTEEQLLGRIVQHRQNMGYPLVSEGFHSLGNEIEDWICQHRIQPQDRERLCKSNSGPPSAQPGSILALMIHKVTGRHASTCG